MVVNDDDAAMVMFTAKHKHRFANHDGEATITDNQCSNASTVQPKPSVQPHCSSVDKQSITGECDYQKDTIDEFKVGDVVRIQLKGKNIAGIITDKFMTSGGEHRLKARPLNSSNVVTLAMNQVSHFHDDPADIPTTHSDVDRAAIASVLTYDELKQLWKGDSDNTMSPESRTALRWHHRLHCVPLRTLHRLASRGVLPRSILKVKVMPLCASCAFAAAHRRKWRSKGRKESSIRRQTHTFPGAGTSCDHIVSHQPGLIPQATGKPTNKRFWGSVLYCDHHSDFLYNHLICGTTSEATLQSKHAYEQLARTHGVQIRSYHADNLRFNDVRFRTDCNKMGQHLTYCGVGAHHQNAVVESKIKEVCYGGRTILLHAKRKWPDVISTALWPFAVQSIVDRHNKLSLDPKGRSPLEKFSGVDCNIPVNDFRTWGCPVYILEPQNQSGTIGTRKWDPRSHIGVNLGHSPCHATTVALVLNLKTGLVSPQYHVVYDEEFSTVPYLSSIEEPPNWPDLLHKHTVHYVDDDEIASPSWLYPSEPVIATSSEGESFNTSPRSCSTNNDSTSSKLPNEPQRLNHHQNGGGESSVNAPARFVDVETLGLRRSERIKQRRSKPIYTFLAAVATTLLDATLATTAYATECFQTRAALYDDFLDRSFDGTNNQTSILSQIYYTSQANNEVYNLREMLAQPDRQDFVKAMEEEVDSMFREKIWTTVPPKQMEAHYRSKRVEEQQVRRQQIMMIWSFKRKRHPDGSLKRHKARLCCHGGQQQHGRNY